MRVLVCGGRDYSNEYYLYDILNAFNRGLPITTLIQGGASGADRFARQWAFAQEIIIEEYAPDWEKHGKAAGPIRNKQMLEEGKPDLVVAFPGGKGTANMVQLAREANIEVKEIT